MINFKEFADISTSRLVVDVMDNAGIIQFPEDLTMLDDYIEFLYEQGVKPEDYNIYWLDTGADYGHPEELLIIIDYN